MSGTLNWPRGGPSALAVRGFTKYIIIISIIIIEIIILNNSNIK